MSRNSCRAIFLPTSAASATTARAARSAARASLLLAAALLALTGAACGSDSSGDDGPTPDPDSVTPSAKALVKFKGNDRILADMSRALDLDPAEVCNEFGQYSCTHLVHRVSLGGTEAYSQGLYRPLPDATVTGPIAADRVAMSAC
ncbi:MAG: hypothetical protein AAGC55_29700, partial [Myxococcota bacterium]